MKQRSARMVVGGLVLACAGCAVGPPPAPPPFDTAAQNCREFVQPIIVDGRTMPGYGVTCQQVDGSWQTVLPPQPTPPPSAMLKPIPPYGLSAANPGSLVPPGALDFQITPDISLQVGAGDLYGPSWGDLVGPQSRPYPP